MGRVPGGCRRSRMAMLTGIVGMVVGYHHRSNSKMRVRVDGHSNNRMEMEDGHSRGREMLGTGDREGTGRGGNKFSCFQDAEGMCGRCLESRCCQRYSMHCCTPLSHSRRCPIPNLHRAMDSQAQDTHQPLIPLCTIISIHTTTSLGIRIGMNVPSLLQPHNIINDVPIQLRKHALQRLHYNFMFLRLDPSCLLCFGRGLACCCVFG
jgi:hypothetical protein